MYKGCLVGNVLAQETNQSLTTGMPNNSASSDDSHVGEIGDRLGRAMDKVLPQAAAA